MFSFNILCLLKCPPVSLLNISRHASVPLTILEINNDHRIIVYSTVCKIIVLNSRVLLGQTKLMSSTCAAAPQLLPSEQWAVVRCIGVNQLRLSDPPLNGVYSRWIMFTKDLSKPNPIL